MTDFYEKSGITPTGQHPSIRVLSIPERIRQQYLSLIKNSVSEVLLIFPTINSIHREYSIGVLDELKNAVQRGVKIRILSAEDDFVKDKLDSLRASGIIIRRIETPTESKFKMLIIDRKSAYIVETKDDSKAAFKDAIGNAVFSNSKSAVLPFVTIFESFWRETDLYEKAKESDRVKDEFVNIAAHELRNPIMPIISGAELIDDIVDKVKEKIDKDIYNELLVNSKMIVRNATRLFRLSEDILQVSRIENGTFALNMELTNVNEILESAITDVKKRYEGEKPKVKLILDSKLEQSSNEIRKANELKIYCDPSKISQTLMNLLDNAMKFTSEGEILVTAWTNSAEVIISVRDCGSGIDPAIRDRLFEKFATKSNSGTGLGLYLSKKIVEAHGGRIWATDNSDGRGTTFSFSIPNDIYPLTATTNDIVKPKVRQ